MSSSSANASGQSSVAIISDAVKSVSDAFVQTFTGAGQAVTGVATSLVTGAKSIVGDASSAITSGVASVAQGVGSLTASLGPVGAIIGGVASTVSAVTGAVMGVASAVASTVLNVGSAVLNVATTVVTSVVSIVGTAISTCATFISTVAGIFTAATAALSVLGPIVMAVGAVFAGVASIIGSVIGALASAVSGIVSAITAVVSGLTSAFKSVSESLGALASVAGEALGGFINAVQSCVESLITHAQNITSISNNTGMSTSQASNLTTDFQALGVSSKETAQIFNSIKMNPDMFNARSSATGLANVNSENFIAEEARLFQDLKKSIGLPAAMARLNAQFGGKAPEAIVRLVNMDPKKLQANVNYGRAVNKELGVGDSEIKAASEDLPLLMSRVSMFVDAVKMRFAADLLPSLQAAFSVVSEFFKNNASNISNIMQTATRAIFVDGPDLAAKAALTVIDWASALANAFFGVVEAGIGLLEAFGNRSGVLYSVLLGFAKIIDGALSIANRLRGVRGGGPKTVMQDALKGIADKAKGVDTKGIRDKVENIKKEGQSIADTAKTRVTDFHAKFGTTEERNAKYDQQLLQSKQSLEEQKRSNSLQEKQLDVSQQHLDATKGNHSGGGSGGQIVARMGAYLAQDAYRLTSR